MSVEQLYSIFLKHPQVCTDTRKIQSGCIFFALKGDNFDGNEYAHTALKTGAVYAVVDNPAIATDSRCILVTDVLTTLQQLAHHHRKQFSIPVLAITGSNGKTTTKELIVAVLRTRYRLHATVGNLNNHIGVPLTLLAMPSDTEIAVIEMGANHQGEIAAYCEVAAPTHGIITNCGKAHIEGFGGVEGVRKGKGELYRYLQKHNGTIFRNADLDYLEAMADGIEQQITYGTGNAACIGEPVQDGIFAGVAMTTPGGRIHFKTNLVGAYNFANVMTAIAIGQHFEVPVESIRQAVAQYTPDNSRSQWMQLGSNRVILDAYNANPTSMRAAITNLAAADLPNKTLWIGGMKEMGEAEHQEHAELLALIAEYEWADVIIVGKEFKAVADGHTWFATSTEAAEYIKSHKPADSTILIKGSRGSRMEVMLDALRQ